MDFWSGLFVFCVVLVAGLVQTVTGFVMLIAVPLSRDSEGREAERLMFTGM